MHAHRPFPSAEAVSAAVLAALAVLTGAARSPERWEYGPLADALRAGHGLARRTPGGWEPSAFVEPYYPGLLAAAEALAGAAGGAALVVALQIGALVLAARLVAGVASRTLGVPRAAAVLVVALWPPLVVSSLKLHPQAFRALLLAGLVVAADAWRRSRARAPEGGTMETVRRDALAGALAGACVWARSVYLVPALALLAWARPPRRSLAMAAGIALLVAAPWWLRNAVAFGSFVPFTTNGGLNLAMGNHPGASGEANDEARRGAAALVWSPPRGEVEVDRALGRAALAWMRAHPADALAGWGRKLAWLVWMRPGAGERYPRLLLWAYGLFAVAATPLLALGAWRAAPAARAALLAPALALLATFAFFAVNGRYRFEADVLLAPFALAGAMTVREAWRSRARRAHWRRSLAAGALIVAAVPAGALAGRPEWPAAALVRDDRPARADAVFVASGDVDYHRTRHAADVFRRTGARWFVVSGAGSGGDSGALMADAAVAAGVPRAAILVEERATSTRENVLFSRALLPDGARVIAVVTDPLHSRRLAMAAERAWPGVRVVAATVPENEDPLACPVARWRESRRCRAAVAEEWEKLLGYLALGWL